MPLHLACSKIPSADLAFTNLAYVHPSDFKALSDEAKQFAPASLMENGSQVRCALKNGLILNLTAMAEIEEGNLALNGTQRKSGRIGLDDLVDIELFTEPVPVIESATVVAAPIRGSSGSIKDVELTIELSRRFGSQVFCGGQRFVALVGDLQIDLQIEAMKANGKQNVFHGKIDQASQIEYNCDMNTGLNIKQTMMQADKLFDTHFNFESLGIGGLDAEFQDIFRRAFASRVHPPHILEELGISHVKGMILHGPPGTGKTLIARQIGRALKCEEPKVVNGPEVLNKYVGQSEENIRNLFKDAEEEQAKKGDNSNLHIIIFDELDAICKQRGTVGGGTGTNDSIVNQLLSKIDGVDALNNILIIGMTNRLDMIDEALLRPGRFECHIEIGLPDEPGREQILRIHTANMRSAGRLSSQVELKQLANRTKNFSGAELAGLCRSAASYALNREIDFNDLSKAMDVDGIKIGVPDFEKALDEVHAGYGADEEALEMRYRTGILEFSNECRSVINAIDAVIKQQRQHTRTPVFSMLLSGIHGSGKTALACYMAAKSKFPFVKLISPDDDKLVGQSEFGKLNFINKVFNDAYKSDLSLIIVDDIERLIDYTPIGPRFSNALLQTLIVLMRKAPKKEGRRLLVIATTSQESFLRDVGMLSAFQATYTVPAVRTPRQLRRVLEGTGRNIPESEIAKVVAHIDETSKRSHDVFGIKQVLTALEMAHAATDGQVSSSAIISAMRDVGIGRDGAIGLLD